MDRTLLDIVAVVPCIATVIFGTAGVVGLFRFRDPYSRLQAGSLCGTTAVFSAFMVAAILSPDWTVVVRVVIITLFFLISAPTGSHIVGRFAWNAGVHPLRISRSSRELNRRSKP